jgi:hypothetical protein
MPILKQALQPTTAQEAALNNLERAFNRAASGLNAVCSDDMPRMPSARLQAIEARLDITWGADRRRDAHPWFAGIPTAS